MCWACDFETTNNTEDCRVWCWGAENVYTGEYKRGLDIFSFMGFVARCMEKDFYFHNLKFDGGFILDWFLNCGRKYTEERFPSQFEFNTLISDMGQFYTIGSKMGGRQRRFIDSLKVLPFPIAQIPNLFGFPESKGEIDYNKWRPVGYEPTADEWEYLYKDVHILAKALKYLFDNGQTKLTAASNAFSKLKSKFDKKAWKRIFPCVPRETDALIRAAYKGGYCIVGPLAQKGDVGSGIVLDKNSMYPWVMAECMLPYGEPVQFAGVYTPDELYPLYVQRLSCSFEVKDGYLPTIQLKHTFGFSGVEYLKSSRGEVVQLTLTNPDIALFFEHYNVFNVQYDGGFKFRGAEGLLRDFVEDEYHGKEQASKEGNKAKRTLHKLTMNSAYGKFAKRGYGASKIPWLDNDGVVRYKMGEPEDRDLEYIPMGCFITAWARNDIIRLGQKYYDRLLYIDTDSLHLLGDELPDMDLDPYRLGAWDCETSFRRARYLRAKTYIEETHEGELIVKCAGLPKNARASVTWENFHVGSVYEGKLQHKTVKGGVVLSPTTFKIKV